MNFNLISPQSTGELLEVIAENQSNKFRFGAGCTDLILELKKQPDEELIVINLAQLSDNRFTSIEKNHDEVRIGALVTANSITSDEELRRRFPVLYESANKLGSRQIRQVATIGGNLCTASPAGDIACALAALEARCEILSANGITRIIPMNDFFIDVRKTDLKNDEILRSVLTPANNESPKVYSDYIKIGTRCSMEIAVVSLAYHIQADEDDKITKAGIAIGSVAPTIKLVKSACEYLIGRDFSAVSSSEAEEFAAKVVEYASPISDIRASAWYREEVLYNISKSIFEN
ncbi:MAG: FAD binding domain-containing protein [candidate division Zixibacteria bacterium]|nr:FAD binding domain-containing protein [Candidatus Tariuqbacter arcticus]